MARHIAIAFLVLSFLSCFATHAQQDYLFLHLRWPGGLCAKPGGCCFPKTYPKQNDFTVSFLARNFYAGINCSDISFDKCALRPIINELNKYWPSFDCFDCIFDANMQEWEQIWNDNGPCTGLAVRDYFTKALNLLKKANLLDLLSKQGIRPSNYNTYRLSAVVNAIDQGLGVVNTTVVSCGSAKLERITNVRLCVDITATKFITCPQARPSVCAESVKLQVLPNDDATLVVEENPIETVVAL